MYGVAGRKYGDGGRSPVSNKDSPTQNGPHVHQITKAHLVKTKMFSWQTQTCKANSLHVT